MCNDKQKNASTSSYILVSILNRKTLILLIVRAIERSDFYLIDKEIQGKIRSKIYITY